MLPKSPGKRYCAARCRRQHTPSTGCSHRTRSNSPLSGSNTLQSERAHVPWRLGPTSEFRERAAKIRCLHIGRSRIDGSEPRTTRGPNQRPGPRSHTLGAMRRTSATGCRLGLRRACLAAMRQQLSSADRGVHIPASIFEQNRVLRCPVSMTERPVGGECWIYSA